jgi:enamine deaminase RidA (YjgF/YER057c/UK114 family)
MISALPQCPADWERLAGLLGQIRLPERAVSAGVGPACSRAGPAAGFHRESLHAGPLDVRVDSFYGPQMGYHFNPPGLWAPNGRAFNQGVVQPDGTVVHVTGQVAWDENSNIVGLGDAAAQLDKSFDNVRIVLKRSAARWPTW